MDVGVIEEAKDTCPFTLQDLERVNGTWGTAHVEEYFQGGTSCFARRPLVTARIISHNPSPGKLWGRGALEYWSMPNVKSQISNKSQ
jgi:hypothetical protein